MSVQPILDNLKLGVEPSWGVRYRVGLLVNRDMDPVCTLEELAAELGITKQNAYTEALLALGTFTCLLSVCLRLAPADRTAYLATRPRKGLRLSGSPRRPAAQLAAA